MSAGETSSSLIYHSAKISHRDNSNLFDNRQVWGGKNKYQIQQCLLLWISKVKHWQESEMMWREAEEAVSSFVLKNRRINALQARNSQQAISPPPSCLPHSGPECQKAVQWGVLRQRSAYGNAPADTLLCSAELEEMKPSRQKPDVS